jgi:hypothetical protein
MGKCSKLWTSFSTLNAHNNQNLLVTHTTSLHGFFHCLFPGNGRTAVASDLSPCWRGPGPAHSSAPSVEPSFKLSTENTFWDKSRPFLLTDCSEWFYCILPQYVEKKKTYINNNTRAVKKNKYIFRLMQFIFVKETALLLWWWAWNASSTLNFTDYIIIIYAAIIIFINNYNTMRVFLKWTVARFHANESITSNLLSSGVPQFTKTLQ